jgi:hypothetical protein
LDPAGKKAERRDDDASDEIRRVLLDVIRLLGV